jgi:Zn ribbon nucleic-acid-binding protein
MEKTHEEMILKKLHCKKCNKKLTLKNSSEESIDMNMCYKCFNKQCNEEEKSSQYS